MSQAYLKKMLSFAKKAGDISLKFIEKSNPSLKADNSVITEADRTIAKLAHKHFADLLKTFEHILVEEEDLQASRHLNPETLSKATYIWSIDPIDGTRPYANKLPTFGVSIGLMKNLKPWLGVVYFPALQELFYCDGKSAFWVQRAFTKTAKKTRIKPIDQKITSQSIFYCSDVFFKRFDWDYKDCHVMIHACAVVEFCWPSIGRGCGALVRPSLWDFAGSWPIFQAAGLQLRTLSTGKVLDSVDINAFSVDKQSWKLKEPYIVSSETNYKILKNKMRAREHNS